MIRNGRPYTNENGWEDKGLLSDKSAAVQETVLSWIKGHIRESRTIYEYRTSYGLKHDLQRDTKIYLTNNEFKDAMMTGGFYPVDPDELNWHYRIDVLDREEPDPDSFEGWVIRTYGKKDGPKGDFARDVKRDDSFPRENSRDAIDFYLTYRFACQEHSQRSIRYGSSMKNTKEKQLPGRKAERGTTAGKACNGLFSFAKKEEL